MSLRSLSRAFVIVTAALVVPTGASAGGPILRRAVPAPMRPASQIAPNNANPLAATEAVLYSFKSGTDGASPFAGLSTDTKGNLYGTTQAGGTTTCDGTTVGCGTVFKLTPSGKTYTYATIFRFKNTGASGATPNGGVIADADGDLYGTATAGGVGCTNLGQEIKGCGVVYELKPSGKTYVETLLHSFDNSAKDGFSPFGGLIRTSAGVLRGTASGGGPNGRGIVFKLTPSGNAYTETILYSFNGTPAGDGSTPMSTLVADAKGALYGTTYYGGAKDGGTVFKMTPSGNAFTEKAIHSFTPSSTIDGENPEAAVVVTKGGAVFGVTPFGGKNGGGIVFELAAASYAEKVLHPFAGVSASDGAQPVSGLTQVGTAFYGTTIEGGVTACVEGCGTVFKLTPKGGTYGESVVYAFGMQPDEEDGGFPEGTLIAKGATLYGTTSVGGAVHGSGPGPGTIFSLLP
jgi:uncharacterized repeat protein (TIGR03803 family)